MSSTLFHIVKQYGGISSSKLHSCGYAAHETFLQNGLLGIFRKHGISLDDMASELIGLGIIPDCPDDMAPSDWLMDLLIRERQGIDVTIARIEAADEWLEEAEARAYEELQEEYGEEETRRFKAEFDEDFIEEEEIKEDFGSAERGERNPENAPDVVLKFPVSYRPRNAHKSLRLQAVSLAMSFPVCKATLHVPACFARAGPEERARGRPIPGDTPIPAHTGAYREEAHTSARDFYPIPAYHPRIIDIPRNKGHGDRVCKALFLNVTWSTTWAIRHIPEERTGAY